ncbi:ankyrin repeat domain-containing protein 23-like isoform X2 [Periplaneta americana]|uniref:ankyrin repeat domain-containing protein 23-like isoform X2 n=1 Tax=Periplaneta americana TaxID=6978 RepID=UPI0037E7BA51
MKETSSSVTPVIAQSPVPAFVMMLQYLFHQGNKTTDECTLFRENISRLHKENLNLASEKSRLEKIVIQLQSKIELLMLENETEKFEKLVAVAGQESNCSAEVQVGQEAVHVQDVTPRETLKRFIEVFLKKATPECNKGRALLLAVRSNDLAMTSALIATGTDVNTEDALGWNRTPLHWAAIQNYLDIAQVLLDGGANIESRETGIYNLYTPLHEASKHGHLSMCRLLLDAKAEPNSKDGAGSTPLHTAARNGHLAVVKLLVERGATVSAKDNWGSTARDRALKFSHKDVDTWLSDFAFRDGL